MLRGELQGTKMLSHLGNQTESRPRDVPVGLVQLWLSSELHLTHGSRSDAAAGGGALKTW